MTSRRKAVDVMKVRRYQPTRLEGFVDSAFAFAVTLIVISIGHVPSSVGEMLHALRGLPTFAVCFLLIARFWAAHRYWSRHYDIEDRPAVVMSLLLVFVVLIYVYPLRVLFSMMFDGISGGLLADQPFVLANIFELRAAYAVFGLGFAAIAFIFASLFRHALAHAADIGLGADEIVVTRFRILRWCATGIVSLISVLVAATMSFDTDKPWLFAVPGCVYLILSFTRPLLARMAADKLNESSP
jgi:uncharacterized membrane protein